MPLKFNDVALHQVQIDSAKKQISDFQNDLRIIEQNKELMNVRTMVAQNEQNL